MDHQELYINYLHYFDVSQQAEKYRGSELSTSLNEKAKNCLFDIVRVLRTRHIDSETIIHTVLSAQQTVFEISRLNTHKSSGFFHSSI